MSNYRHLLLLFVICLACSCNPAKMIIAFDENRINAPFFRDMATGADSIIIYKTSFREKYVNEKSTGVLQFANLSDQELGLAFKYLNVRGDSQDIYLVRLVKGDQSRFVYFSAKYGTFPDANGYPVVHCKGFGPACTGLYDPLFNVINLSKALRIDKHGNIHYKSGKNPKPVFIPKGTIANASHEPLLIKEIMFGEYNKYGGRRPVVMPASCIFNDKSIECLEFRYLKTINSN